ncbi:MAG: Ni/Fe hydrogenase subunit alpha [Planctomycetaceae bacterium]|jgi:sulfhydrogenase subunit alpha
MSETRTVRVEILSRVEGEGALHIETRQGRLERVELQIYEPPRLFESLLRGRPLEEAPDITARICGICPVAYQMTAVHALEKALEVRITPEIRRLRRLLYCGEWIESHALHMHLLHAPDFLGYDSGLAMAADHPQEVNRGLRLKKHGNQLLEVLGGRAIHPINVAVGGFHRAPHRERLQRLIPDFEWGLQGAIEATRWVAGLSFPDYSREYNFVALRHPDEYPFNEGAVASSRGETIDVDAYELHFEEVHVPHSTALHSETRPGGACYHVGPLARIALNREQLAEPARRLADELGFETPCGNPYRSIVARGLELVHAYAEALEILRDYREFQPHRMPYVPRQGAGCAATEAPRGLIFHRYGITAEGRIDFAKIVPPTSQNQKQIEDDLRDWLPGVLDRPDAELARSAEALVRNYDPCISCSTHFLRVQRHDH